MAGAVLEVRGVAPETPEELLVLYFESRRRSGGGPVRSCQRLGALLFLTFEEPRDAQNVLTHGRHRFGGAELGVRPAPPWDPSHLLLRAPAPGTPAPGTPAPGTPAPGTPPEPPPWAVLGVPVTPCRCPAPGWSLLRLRDPLSATELASAERRARQRGLQLLRVPRSPSVLVRPPLGRDLLELYFENRRSGGGPVSEVRPLPGGRGAVVTFQEPAAAERVLQRPHRLQDVALELEPHFSFLEQLGESPDTGPSPEPAPAGDGEGLGAVPGRARRSGNAAAAVPEPVLEPVPVPELVPAEPVSVLEPVSVPEPVPAEPVSFPEPVPEPVSVPEPVPEPVPVLFPVPVPVPVPAQDEALVPAEPGAVRYLQQHCQDVLGCVPEVSVLPLEGGDIAGFRVSGEPGRCRAVADFLQSLLDSVASHATTLRFPGVARFLRDPAGQSLLRQLESRFQCVIQLDGDPWSPPEPQLELEELLPPRSSRPRRREPPEDGDNGDSFHSDAEEIKELMAALRPRDPESGAPGADGAGAAAEEEEEEEEVRVALAVQRSLDRAWCEEQELALATALSLRSYGRERERERLDAGLLAALEASLEEAAPAEDEARATAFGASEREAAAAARELQRELAARQRVRALSDERLRAPAAAGRCALALLRRRHAVGLGLSGGTATLRGFAEYTERAARELAALLPRMPQPGHDDGDEEEEEEEAEAAAARWVRWDSSGTAVPYGPEAAALLERAWERRERRLELVLDGRPLTVDLERMEELDVGSARAAPVCRSRPPPDSACRPLGPGAAGLEEEVRLMELAEDSEEYAETARRFHATLEELQGQISIVQVQKLIHPVLYEQYQLKKGSVQRECPAGTAAERVLFHGTTQASSREICLHGFNRSFCGRNATLYGRGVYFAARSAVSARDRYSPPGAGGAKFIFVAKVLTGEFAPGRPGLRAPPLRAGAGAPRRFHSVVDDPRSPDVFVVFNDTQAYPQYLVTCRSRRGGPL